MSSVSFRPTSPFRKRTPGGFRPGCSCCNPLTVHETRVLARRQERRDARKDIQERLQEMAEAEAAWLREMQDMYEDEVSIGFDPFELEVSGMSWDAYDKMVQERRRQYKHSLTMQQHPRF